MEIIQTNHGIIHRAEPGKKVHFKGSDRYYSEILTLEETDNIEEVEGE